MTATLHISMTIIWLVLMIAFLAVEIATVGLTSIWFAGGALASLILSLFEAPVLLQVAVFFAVSIGLLLSTRKIFVEKLGLGSQATNVDALIGELGQVIVQIEPFNVGQVKLQGKVWSAIAEDNNTIIKEGTPVIVTAIEGVKLIVKTEN